LRLGKVLDISTQIQSLGAYAGYSGYSGAYLDVYLFFIIVIIIIYYLLFISYIFVCVFLDIPATFWMFWILEPTWMWDLEHK